MDGSIRLQGGTNVEGRVEVCIHSVWRTVCSDSWDNRDAAVACAQLGFSSPSKSMDRLPVVAAE